MSTSINWNALLLKSLQYHTAGSTVTPNDNTLPDIDKQWLHEALTHNVVNVQHELQSIIIIFNITNSTEAKLFIDLLHTNQQNFSSRIMEEYNINVVYLQSLNDLQLLQYIQRLQINILPVLDRYLEDINYSIDYIKLHGCDVLIRQLELHSSNKQSNNNNSDELVVLLLQCLSTLLQNNPLAYHTVHRHNPTFHTLVISLLQSHNLSIINKTLLCISAYIRNSTDAGVVQQLVELDLLHKIYTILQYDRVTERVQIKVYRLLMHCCTVDESCIYNTVMTQQIIPYVIQYIHHSIDNIHEIDVTESILQLLAVLIQSNRNSKEPHYDWKSAKSTLQKLLQSNFGDSDSKQQFLQYC